MDERKRPLHPDDADQSKAIGQAIRATRQGRFTLEALGARAGISIGQLSQLENGRGNPTVEMMIRIGAAFRMGAVDFLERKAPAPTQVIRADERRKHVLGDGREVALLTPGLRYEFTVTSMGLAPGESRKSLDFLGHNVFYVLDGQLSVHLGGTTHVLDEGDALFCPTADRLTNAGTEPVDFLVYFRPEGE